MYCRLLLKLILRDRAVWISTLVLAAAFSIPIAFNSPIYGPFFMKQGMQGFVDAFNTRAPQASGTDLSPEQQDDAELARYANAALAAQTDAAFLDSAESYYALMGEGFQSGSIVGDRETNDADLAYCRALSSSGITDIPASANDLPFLSFLRCIDACRGPGIRRGLFCGRRRCDTFAQTAWTREKAPWARASGRERGIRKHDDTFNRIAFLEPGNGGGPHCSQRLGENHLS